MGMAEYTKWGIEYPWHVTDGMVIPKDCGCKYCRERRLEEMRKRRDLEYRYKKTGGW